MFFEDFDENFNTLIAKSADLTNKPFMHSVVKISGEYERDNEDIDLIMNILCRDNNGCLLYTSPSPRDGQISRMPSSA